MDLASVEERLARAEAGPILLDPRLLRRIIKRHRAVPGLGLEVPHARCYAVRREVLLGIVSPAELGRPAASLPDEVILLPRPTEAELRIEPPEELLTQLWRSAFHAAIHLEIERSIAGGALTTARIRERIHRIGETEFDEVRLVLRHDENLLPPYDDRETFTEFAAIYLELRSFDPGLLDLLFPTLRDRDRVDGAIDIDAAPLLARTRPRGLAETPAPELSYPPSSRGIAPRTLDPPKSRAPKAAAMDSFFARADIARLKGNDVRAALLGLAAIEVAPPEKEAVLLAAVRADLDSLAARLNRALRFEASPTAARAPMIAAWSPLLLTLARAGFRRSLRHTVEARLLFDLQSAAVARERPQSAVDLVEFVLSFGRRPIVRPLPAAVFVRVARCIHHAEKKLHSIAVDPTCLRGLSSLVHNAAERAEENVRSALRPRIFEVLDAVRLTPQDASERVARAKLTEELLDQAAHHGFLGIGHLRDALSRNQLKLTSLSGPRELLFGDPLLKADRLLGVALDGVYRRAEIYLRSLQRVSSVAFGTAPGRFLTLYLILPIGASFVLLIGLSHLISLIIGLLGHHHEVELDTPPLVVVVSVILFTFLHSSLARSWGKRALVAARWVLGSVFLRFPRYLAHLPFVQAVIRSRLARAVGRYLLKPALIVGSLWLIVLRLLPLPVGAVVAAALVVALEIALISPAGVLLEEIVVDWLARRIRTLSRSVIPGLIRLIDDVFNYLTDLVERAVYTVDEWLRFREGQSLINLAAKALLGLVWFFVAYLLRIAVNLLIEPQINPIKHFPVVTVSHKIILPMSGSIIHGIRVVLTPIFGRSAARAIAGPAPLLLPGVFGFLVWELKENWKLYRSTRAKELHPVMIGHHGETMSALMKPGFHSGTLPKLYQKVRRAARRADGSLEKHEARLREVEEALRRFADRELAASLNGARRFRAGAVRVGSVELGSNRITLGGECTADAESTREALPERPCRIAFEEQSGLLLASISDPGWLDGLTDEERVIAENAVAGLYHLAGVDVAREQLETALRGEHESAPPYDIGSAGLVVWPAAEERLPEPGEPARRELEYRTEIVYDFRGGKTMTPVIRGEPPAEAPLPLESRVIFYRSQPVAWATWVAAWDAASAEEGEVPRVLNGASILPRRGRGGAHSAA